MRVRRRTSQFGWLGDGGLGLRLIDAIKAGTKTATCCPAALCTNAELAETRASVGHLLTVIDRLGAPHCTIRMLDVFETTWGAPDARLVRGEGHATAEEFRRAHAHVWDDVLAANGMALHAETALVVELFELAVDERCRRTPHRG